MNLKTFLWGWAAVGLGLVVGGCFDFSPVRSKGECSVNRDCGSGSICSQHSCYKLCTLQRECPESDYCALDQLCRSRKDGPVPDITAIAGNAVVSGQLKDGLWVSGFNLAEATFELNSSSETVALAVRSRTDEAVEVVLPVTARSGRYSLSATNQSGNDNEPVTLTLPELTGDLLLGKLNNESTGQLAEARLPERFCPAGYARDTSAADFVLCKRGADEMVKVGDFWVDRYESLVVAASVYNNGLCNGTCSEAAAANCTICTCFGSQESGGASPVDNYPDTFPDNGNWTTPLYACSRAGYVPSRMLTYFQAQQACALAGKHLIHDGEWLTAGVSSPLSGSTNGTSGTCNNQNSGPRKSGGASSCRSKWGAEDMVGNLSEMTSLWQMEPGYNGTPSVFPAVGATSYGGAGYYHGGSISDSLHGTDGSHLVEAGHTTARIPAMARRGSTWNAGPAGSPYGVSVHSGATMWNPDTGFRCARSW